MESGAELVKVSLCFINSGLTKIDKTKQKISTCSHRIQPQGRNILEFTIISKRIFAFLMSERGHDQMYVLNMKQILQALEN